MAVLNSEGKMPCVKEELASLEMIIEKEWRHDLTMIEGKGSTEEGLILVERMRVSTSAGVTGGKLKKEIFERLSKWCGEGG
jgi:hypothetical protein